MILTMAVVEDLSDAERRVWEAFPKGELVDFCERNTSINDPAKSDQWNANRHVRAEVVSALLCGAVPVEPGHLGEVYVRGAFFDGMIDLHEVEVKHPLRLDGCVVPGGIRLSNATARSISLRGCRLGVITMEGARVTGDIDLCAAQLDGMGKRVLNCDGLTVTGRMNCCEGFTATGLVSLVGPELGHVSALRASAIRWPGLSWFVKAEVVH